MIASETVGGSGQIASGAKVWKPSTLGGSVGGDPPPKTIGTISDTLLKALAFKADS